MRMTLAAAATATAALIATQAIASEPFGIWQTKSDDNGAYLLVEVLPCETDEAKLCSRVTEVINSPHQEIVGRPIFWDMVTEDGKNWDRGRVWDALTNEEYDAKVILGKTALRVEGCVGILCDGQNWKRPE